MQHYLRLASNPHHNQGNQPSRFSRDNPGDFLRDAKTSRFLISVPTGHKMSPITKQEKSLHTKILAKNNVPVLTKNNMVTLTTTVIKPANIAALKPIQIHFEMLNIKVAKLL